VATIDRKVDSGFARIVLAPSAQPDGVRHVLVLDPVGLQMPARPEPVAPPDPKASAAKASSARAAAAKASEPRAPETKASAAKTPAPKASGVRRP
jgi:rod shape-determining protein MreC